MNWIFNLSEREQKSYSLIEDEIQDVESGFELDVLNWLKNQRFLKLVKIRKQFPIGSYRIDLALFDEMDNYLVGIEVDGYKYHSSANQRYNDIEAKGYRIIRISEILWKTNKDLV